MTLEQLKSWRAACLKAGDEADAPELACLAYDLATCIANTMDRFAEHTSYWAVRALFHPNQTPGGP